MAASNGHPGRLQLELSRKRWRAALVEFSWVGKSFWRLKGFPAKWMPVRVKKTRKNKKLEPRSNSIGSEQAFAGYRKCVSRKHRLAEPPARQNRQGKTPLAVRREKVALMLRHDQRRRATITQKGAGGAGCRKKLKLENFLGVSRFRGCRAARPTGTA